MAQRMTIKRLNSFVISAAPIAIALVNPSESYVTAASLNGIVPVAAIDANGAVGSGVYLSKLRRLSSVAARLAIRPRLTVSLPLSIDLSLNAPPVGNQGQVGSCAAWAEDYGLRGYYAKLGGYYPTGGFEPMYTYSQVTRENNGGAPGADTGSATGQNADILKTQGIDTRAHYTQGDFDYVSAPNSAEMDNAATYKIASYSIISREKQTVETELAGGTPVVLAVLVTNSFVHPDSANPLIPGYPGQSILGGHEIAAYGYDAQGVWFQNSWGTSWGKNGWAEMSWAYLNQYGDQGLVETPKTPSVVATVTPTSQPPTVTPRPTATTPVPTSTPRPTATSMSRPTAAIVPAVATRVTATTIPRPTDTATSRPAVSATAKSNITATAIVRPAETATILPSATATSMPPIVTPTSVAQSTVTIVSTLAYGPVTFGQGLGVGVYVRANIARTAEGVDVKILDPSGRQVYEGMQVVPLTPGVSRGLGFIWTTPQSAAAGLYSVRVTVLQTTNGVTSSVDAVSDPAATFIVKPSSAR